MSRSGYCENDGLENWSMICWAGAVKSAIRGERGQAMLREVLAALDSLPEKKLVAESLVDAEGQYCTLGALGRARNIDMTKIDPEDYDAVAEMFGIAVALAREIMWMNDECVDEKKWIKIEICGPVRPYIYWERDHTTSTLVDNENAAQERFNVMREWVSKNIIEINP